MADANALRKIGVGLGVTTLGVSTAAPANRPNTGTNAPADRPARATSEKWYPDHVVIQSTKDQLKAMPQFRYSSYN